MSVKDGQFFDLNDRILQKEKYKDPSGTPALRSEELIRPFKRSIVVSAGALWDHITVKRAVNIRTPDFRQIDFINGTHPGDLSADTAKPWHSSVTGVAKLFAPGEWHFKTPLIGADVEGKKVTLVVADAALGIDGVNLTASELIGNQNSGAIQDSNLKQLGGTAQTGADFGALVARLLAERLPIVWGNEALVAYAAADGAVLAANGARRGLSFWNASATQTVALTVKNPATQLAGFLVLPPLAGYTYGPDDLPTRQIIRSWGSGAGSLSVVEGT